MRGQVLWILGASFGLFTSFRAVFPKKFLGALSVDTPALGRIVLPPMRIVGTTPTRVQEALALHAGRSYAAWAALVANAWQGIPYGSGGAGLGPEMLLLNLNQMDCMTAIENLMALHLAYKERFLSLEGVASKLLQVRYKAYPPCRWEDRYHYLTHAFIEWEKAGYGVWLPLGEKDTHLIRYISQNSKKYRGFRDWELIQEIEQQLTKRPRYFIPSADIHHWLPALRDGDIVAFVPTEGGLDVSHVGVFLGKEGRPTFAHASLVAKKWVIDEDLCAYLDRRKEKIRGITVFRPFE
jgi:hypothetical protein